MQKKGTGERGSAKMRIGEGRKQNPSSWGLKLRPAAVGTQAVKFQFRPQSHKVKRYSHSDFYDSVASSSSSWTPTVELCDDETRKQGERSEAVAGKAAIEYGVTDPLSQHPTPDTLITRPDTKLACSTPRREPQPSLNLKQQGSDLETNPYSVSILN